MPYPYPTLHIPFQPYDKNMTDLQETKESGTVYPFVVDTAIFLQADDYRMFWHEENPDYAHKNFQGWEEKFPCRSRSRRSVAMR